MSKSKKSKSTGMSVMLRPGNPGVFRRSRRDEKGNVLETHIFEPRTPFEVTEEWVDALRNDIGRALVIVTLVEKDGMILPRIDSDATEAVVLDRDGKLPEPQESATVREVTDDPDALEA